MKQMHDLVELMPGWLADVQKMHSSTLVSLMKMGAKVKKLLEVKNKLTGKVSSGLAAGKAVKKAPTGRPSAFAEVVASRSETGDDSPDRSKDK
jgi:hypothetical protein